MKKICIFTFAGRPSSSINEKSIKKSCCLNEMAAGFFCILREGEHEAPRELQALLDCGNRFRQIVMDNLHVGKQGNAVFAEAMRLANREGIQPMLYTHPVGTFGHGAGPIIGLYTNQGFVPGTGERTIEEDTCFALELNVYDNLSCWDGQRVFMYLEENICRAAQNDYIDGHQIKLLLI